MVMVKLDTEDVLILQVVTRVLLDCGYPKFSEDVAGIVERAGGHPFPSNPDQAIGLVGELAGLYQAEDLDLDDLLDGRTHLPSTVHFIPKRLKAWLLNHGWTQKAMAEAVGVHETTLGGWLKGATQPAVENLATLSEVTEEPLGYWVKVIA